MSLPPLFISEISTEVKVVAVFDAMMSGLPTHKEDFAGYHFWIQTTFMWCDFLVNEEIDFSDSPFACTYLWVYFTCCFQHPHFFQVQYTCVITLNFLVNPAVKGLYPLHLNIKWIECLMMGILSRIVMTDQHRKSSDILVKTWQTSHFFLQDLKQSINNYY